MTKLHTQFPKENWKLFVQKNLLLLVFTSLFALFYIHPENFKLFFVVNFLVFLLLLYILNNFFFSLYSLFFINLFFLEPGKYYSFEILPSGYVPKEPFFSQGLVDGYGFLISDFLAIGLVIWFIREILKDKKTQLLRVIKTTYRILLGFTIFLLVITYSSWFVSLFPTFSLVNTFQYGKIVIAMLATTLLLQKKSINNKAIFFQLITACLLVNISVGIFQLSSSLLNIAESKEATVQIEDQLLFTRPTGLFLHSNEFGLFMLLFWIIIPKEKTWLSILTTVGAWIFIVFSQSRSVWFSAFVTFAVLCLINNDLRLKTSIFLKKNWSYISKFPILTITLFLIFIGLIVPRIYATRYTLLEGSGSVRLDMIKDGWTLLQFSPIYGFGANTNVLTTFFYIKDSYLRDFPYAIHMGYLQLALEAGILGAFFFFWPFFYLLAINIIQLNIFQKQWLTLKNIFLLSSILIYYVLQPHGGRFEIPLLGFILGYIIYTTDYEKGRF